MSSESPSFYTAEASAPPSPTLNLNQDASKEDEISNPNPNPNPKRRGRKKKEIPIETPPNYLFKFQDELNLNESDPNQIQFKVNDLVWGKVKSHPWWPGQIYDPLQASESALKIQKKDSLLIANFGDNTFSWIEPSDLKPYQSNFHKLEKQNKIESFVAGVDSSLAEITRRIELAFACNCSNIKPLNEILVQNSGIKEGTHLPEVDKSVILDSFNPEKIINYMQEIALFGADYFNKLEFVMARAYIKAFDKYRGFPESSQFVNFEEFGNNPNKINEKSEIIKKRKKKEESETETSKKRGRPKKFKELSDKEYDPKSDSEEKIKKYDTIKKRGRPKKSKDSDEFTSESEEKPKIRKRGSPKKSKRVVKRVETDESDYDDDLTSDSEEKPKIKQRGRPKKFKDDSENDLFTSGSEEKSKIKKRGRPKKINPELSDEEYDPKSTKPKTPIKPNNNNININNNSNSSKKRGRPKKEILPIIPVEYAPSKDMLAQLYIIAKDPVNKDYNFISQLLEFFSQYKNSNLVTNELIEELGKTKSGRRVYRPKYMKDSYWTDILLDTGSDEDEDINEGENVNLPTNDDNDGENEDLVVNGDNDIKKDENENLAIDDNVDIKKDEKEKLVTNDNNDITKDENENLATNDNNNIKKDENENLATNNNNKNNGENEKPTALFLYFNKAEAIPSKNELNNVFRVYGVLFENGTEINEKLNRATIVFKKFEDAEVAFSSMGKYSKFGPSLTSYELTHWRSPVKNVEATSTCTFQDKEEKEGEKLEMMQVDERANE